MTEEQGRRKRARDIEAADHGEHWQAPTLSARSSNERRNNRRTPEARQRRQAKLDESRGALASPDHQRDRGDATEAVDAVSDGELERRRKRQLRFGGPSELAETKPTRADPSASSQRSVEASSAPTAAPTARATKPVARDPHRTKPNPGYEGWLERERRRHHIKAWGY